MGLPDPIAQAWDQCVELRNRSEFTVATASLTDVAEAIGQSEIPFPFRTSAKIRGEPTVWKVACRKTKPGRGRHVTEAIAYTNEFHRIIQRIRVASRERTGLCEGFFGWAYICD